MSTRSDVSTAQKAELGEKPKENRGGIARRWEAESAMSGQFVGPMNNFRWAASGRRRTQASADELSFCNRQEITKFISNLCTKKKVKWGTWHDLLIELSRIGETGNKSIIYLFIRELAIPTYQFRIDTFCNALGQKKNKFYL